MKVFKAAIVLLAVSAAGCGMPGGTLSAPVSSATSQQAATRQGATPLSRSHRKLAGKYNGSIEWSEGGVMHAGTLETILRFHNKNIIGPFRITEEGQTTRYRLFGRIKSKTSEEAHIVFLVYNTKGGFAVGTGTIANGTFAGQGNKASAGPDPISVNFNATKQ